MHFQIIAKEVQQNIRVSLIDKNVEWQRVYSLIADLLKDQGMTFAKLARLQGDFEGEELKLLEQLSERVLEIGNDLSDFVRAFYEGKYTIQKETAFGGGAEMGQPPVPGLPPAAPPEIPVEFEESEPEETEEEEYEEPEAEEKQEQQ